MIVELIGWIVVGALAGWIASKIMKTDAEMGGWSNIIVGIVGAFIGGGIMRLFFNTAVDKNGINFTSILVAILGSVILLAIIKALRPKK